MKSPEELAKEILDGYVRQNYPPLDNIQLKITQVIRLDRESVRKRCAEVARVIKKSIQDGKPTKWDRAGEETAEAIAKAIEEMELK